MTHPILDALPFLEPWLHVKGHPRLTSGPYPTFIGEPTQEEFDRLPKRVQTVLAATLALAYQPLWERHPDSNDILQSSIDLWLSWAALPTRHSRTKANASTRAVRKIAKNLYAEYQTNLRFNLHTVNVHQICQKANQISMAFDAVNSVQVIPKPVFPYHPFFVPFYKDDQRTTNIKKANLKWQAALLKSARPIPRWSPQWTTSDVVGISRAIYDERAPTPDRFAILADALEDAGCNHTKTLTRLRSSLGPHSLADFVITVSLGMWNP